MSLAPSIAVPQARFNWLPLDDPAVLLALELRLHRRQDRRDLLPAADPARRALLARGTSDPGRRRVPARCLAIVMARRRGVRGPWRRQQRALSRPRLYRPAVGFRRPRRTDRLGQPDLYGGAGRAVSRRAADGAQGARPAARDCRRQLHRLASHVGRDRQFARHPVHAGLARFHRGQAPFCSSCSRRRAGSGSAMAFRTWPLGWC